MTQPEREMRAKFEGAFRAHWRPEMSIGANSLNVAKIFAWSMWQAATALAQHEGAQAEPVAWQMRLRPDGGWFDCPVTDYLQHLIDPLIDPAWEVRALYTAAPDTRDAAARLTVDELVDGLQSRIQAAIDAARSTTNG